MASLEFSVEARTKTAAMNKAKRRVNRFYVVDRLVKTSKKLPRNLNEYDVYIRRNKNVKMPVSRTTMPMARRM